MNGEPKTVRELYFYVREKLENIQKEIITLKDRPDDIGKWLVRAAVLGTLVLQAILLAKSWK